MANPGDQWYAPSGNTKESTKNFKAKLKKRNNKKKMEGGGSPRLGNLKGQMRYTPKGYKKVRRFTVKERNAFRTKRKNNSGNSPTGPRPQA